ncbi:hypothetical protein E8E11_010882 [Didymella keratinophila]|nr:hypothetical protein E8E11_010882 [Didymella keratinophila]
METTLVYVPATRRMMPVMVPERILEKQPEPPQPLGQQTPSRYHHLIANVKQLITASRNLRRSALYQLPDELHMIIASHLSTADLLSYSKSSRGTAFLMHYLKAIRLRFRICEHRSYSPEGLERAVWSRPQSPLRAALCPLHQHIVAGILGPELNMVWEQGTFVALFTFTKLLCQLPRDPAMWASSIQEALEQQAAHICPHVNSADEAVWDELNLPWGG